MHALTTTFTLHTPVSPACPASPTSCLRGFANHFQDQAWDPLTLYQPLRGQWLDRSWRGGGALPEIVLLVSPSSSGKPVPGALLSKCTKTEPLHTLVGAFLQVSSPPVIGARMFRKSTFSASPPPSDSVSGTEPQMLGSFPSSHETCLVSFKRWLLFTCCRLRAGSPGGPCRAVRGPSSGLRTAWPEAEAHSGCLTHLTVSPAVRLRARPPPHEHLHRAGECPQHLSACFPPREPSSTRANSAGRTPCFTT